MIELFNINIVIYPLSNGSKYIGCTGTKSCEAASFNGSILEVGYDVECKGTWSCQDSTFVYPYWQTHLSISCQTP